MVQRASSDAPSVSGGHRDSRMGLGIGYAAYQSGYNKLFTQVCLVLFLIKVLFSFYYFFFDLYFCLLFHYLCENKGKQRALIYFLLINQFFFSDLRYSFMFFIAFKVFLLCVFFVKILSLSWHKT